jgi:hypothetical protein
MNESAATAIISSLTTTENHHLRGLDGGFRLKEARRLRSNANDAMLLGETLGARRS